MDIRAVCLVRNEEDIWEQNLRRLVDVLDHVYVVDQSSTDRTASITRSIQAESPGSVSSFSLLQRGNFQSEVSKLMAELAFSQGADWVLFADGDEYIRASNRADLEGALHGHENTVVNFRRRNLVPSEFGSPTSFTIRQLYRTLAEPSDFGKVVISVGWASRFPQFELAPNNTAAAPLGGAMPISGPTVGESLHIPVRSLDQLQTKVEAGIAAHDETSGGDDDGVAHWRAIREKLRGGGGDTALAEIALHYSALGGTPLDPSASPQTVEERAFIDGTIPIEGSTAEPGMMTLVPDTGEPRTSRPAPLTSGKRLALLSGSTVEVGLQPVSGRGAVRGSRFGALPAGAPVRLERSRIVDAVGAAFQRIETPLAGDASIHVPALLFLWRLLAPRRYVELGSRQGVTFFAACQAAKGQEETGECVAIDSWDDDPDGPEADKLLADFEYLLSTRYPHVGHYVRGQVDDAAWCFEDGSIDLLYIDGCRKDAAVLHDVDTWLPKMSARGVILVHGTAEGEAVHSAQFSWKEIEARYPSWTLPTGRGLGVVCVGDPESEAAGLLVRLRADTQWGEALTQMAEGAAGLALAEARRAVALLAKLKRERELAKETLARERKLAAAQATAKIHESLSWRLTVPLRLAGRLFRRVGGSRNE